MTTAHELIILQSEQWIRRVEKLGMENNFNAVVNAIEQIASTNPKSEIKRDKEHERKIMQDINRELSN